MKTTNKILLIASIVGLLTTTYLIIKISSFIQIKALEASGIIESKAFIPEYYEEVYVNNGIKVNLLQDGTNSLKVEIDTAFAEYLEVKVENKKLKLKLQRSLPSTSKVIADLHVSSVKKFGLRSGAELYTMNTFNEDSLRISAISGSKLKMDINTGHLKSHTNSGARVSFTGKTKSADFLATSGTRLNAFDLKVGWAKTECSGGSHINVSVTDSLSVNAKSGGVIEYKGQPGITKMEVSSGGRLIKKD